jgi:hypothetical protein
MVGGLEEWEVVLIGLAVTFVAQLVRWIIQVVKKQKISKAWAYVISLLTSFALALALRIPIFPSWTGFEFFFDWLAGVFQSIQGVIFWATLIYNIVLAQVFDKLGDIIERKLSLRVRG